MTDFNAMPLDEQLKALEPGDELHLRGGGWLPFKSYARSGYIWAYSLQWFHGGERSLNDTNNELDIIRVHRPTARKVPEVVEKLREIAKDREMHGDYVLWGVVTALADHFEKE